MLCLLATRRRKGWREAFKVVSQKLLMGPKLTGAPNSLGRLSLQFQFSFLHVVVKGHSAKWAFTRDFVLLLLLYFHIDQHILYLSSFCAKAALFILKKMLLLYNLNWNEVLKWKQSWNTLHTWEWRLTGDFDVMEKAVEQEMRASLALKPMGITGRLCWTLYSISFSGLLAFLIPGFKAADKDWSMTAKDEWGGVVPTCSVEALGMMRVGMSKTYV